MRGRVGVAVDRTLLTQVARNPIQEKSNLERNVINIVHMIIPTPIAIPIILTVLEVQVLQNMSTCKKGG